MRWDHSVVDLRTFTFPWNKAINDFSLLPQSSILSCVYYSCGMGWHSPEPGLKACCDKLKDQLCCCISWQPCPSLCRTVSHCGSLGSCVFTRWGFVPHLLPVAWCCLGSLVTWTGRVPNLELIRLLTWILLVADPVIFHKQRSWTISTGKHLYAKDFLGKD